MKSSFPIRCQCGHEMVLETVGTDSFKDTSCPKCHSAIWIVDNGFVSTRIFNRSLKELNSSDFTLSIILSAMAVECELARVFVKWNEIALRFDNVCEFLTDQDFDGFIANNINLLKSVQQRHPESAKYGSLKK